MPSGRVGVHVSRHVLGSVCQTYSDAGSWEILSEQFESNKPLCNKLPKPPGAAQGLHRYHHPGDAGQAAVSNGASDRHDGQSHYKYPFLGFRRGLFIAAGGSYGRIESLYGDNPWYGCVVVN